MRDITDAVLASVTFWRERTPTPGMQRDSVRPEFRCRLTSVLHEVLFAQTWCRSRSRSATACAIPYTYAARRQTQHQPPVDLIQLRKRRIHRCLHGFLRGDVRTQMRRVGQLATHQKHMLADFTQLAAEHHMIHLIDAMLRGQRQLTRSHALARLVEGLAQLGIQHAHRFADLCEQRMVRVLGMVRAYRTLGDGRSVGHREPPAQASARGACGRTERDMQVSHRILPGAAAVVNRHFRKSAACSGEQAVGRRALKRSALRRAEGDQHNVASSCQMGADGARCDMSRSYIAISPRRPHRPDDCWLRCVSRCKSAVR